MKREFHSNLSGNEVCYTNSSILLAENMLCSKLHCQKDLNSILFSCKIRVRAEKEHLRRFEKLSSGHGSSQGQNPALTVPILLDSGGGGVPREGMPRRLRFRADG